MDRRTRWLAVLAVTGWALFFGTLLLRSGTADFVERSASNSLANPAPSSLSEPNGGVLIAEPRSAPDTQRTPARASSEPRERTAKSHDELVAEILRKLEEGGSPCFALRRLGELGTAQAGETLIAWFEDADFFVSGGRSRCFAQALAGIEDPRIFEIAQRLMDACIEDGLEREADGYLELIVTKGGRAGAEVLLSVLGSDDLRGLQFSAIGLVSHVDDASLTDDFLQVASEQLFWGDRILTEMAEWTDPSTHAAIGDFARSLDPASGLGMLELQRSAMQAYGRGITQSELTSEVAGYWASADAHGRMLVLACLRGAAMGSSLDDGTLHDIGVGVVGDALRSDDSALAQQARYLIEYNDRLQTDAMLALLEERANDPHVSEEERKDYRALLIQLRRDR